MQFINSTDSLKILTKKHNSLADLEEHPDLQREGNNVIYDLYVSFVDYS